MRAIYDALDSQNYKTAINLCNKLLKKHDSPSVQSLKALALSRSGSSKQALEIALKIKQLMPIDPHLLYSLTLTLKSLLRFQDIADLYQNAFTHYPTAEYAQLWFLSLAASKLSKSFGFSPVWVIVSVYMQHVAACLERTLPNPVLLPLAEKMMEKCQIADFETIRLYLFILEKLSKYEQACTLLRGPLGSLCKVDTDRKRLLLYFLEKSSDWINVELESMLLLEDNPDDWQSHKSYTNAIKNQQSPFKVSQAVAFYQKLTLSPGCTRGPFMGYFELINTSLPDFGQPEYLELIMSFVARFGELLCCFEDIFTHLPRLAPPQQEQLLVKASSLIVLNLQDSQNPVQTTRMNINLLKLIRYFKRSLHHNDHVEQTSLLAALYKSSMHLGEKLDARERQYGDDYLILCSHYILDMYAEDKSQKSLLLSAIGVLEYGLSKSKFNYNIKLLLIRLYIEIGVSKRAFELSESLDIKQMQFDALGYLCVDDMHLFGNYQKCLEFIEASRYIYERNEIETPDMLAKAFEFKTFSKIPEFFEFKDKLANSIQNYSSFYQMISTKLFTLNTYDSIVDYLSSFQKDQFKLDFDRMIDNRDFGIIPTFVSSQETIPALIHGTKFPKDHKSYLLEEKIQITWLIDIISLKAPQNIPEPAELNLLEVKDRSALQVLQQFAKTNWDDPDCSELCQTLQAIKPMEFEPSFEYFEQQSSHLRALLYTAILYNWLNSVMPKQNKANVIKTTLVAVCDKFLQIETTSLQYTFKIDLDLPNVSSHLHESYTSSLEGFAKLLGGIKGMLK